MLATVHIMYPMQLGLLYTTINISLVGRTSVFMEAYDNTYVDCPNTEAHWEIERADGELEVYTVFNDRYGRNEELLDRGLSFEGYCHYACYFCLEISPTDFRYNGAHITGVFNVPECFNSSSNVTDTITLNIQGMNFNDHTFTT